MPASPDVPALLEALAPALAAAPDPDAARVHLLRLLATPGVDVPWLASLDDRSSAHLLHVLSLGVYLTDTLVRSPAALRDIVGPDVRTAPPSVAELADGPRTIDDVRELHRTWMLRLGAADLAGRLSLDEVCGGLSRVADAAVQACLRICAPGDDGGLLVLAYGKLGGAELNYSSDIDLVFIAPDQARLADATRAASALCRALASYSSAGFLYRVDCRLRPWGAAGPLVATAAGWRQYVLGAADPWERQALLRARPIAGDLDLGRRLLDDALPGILGDAPGCRGRIRAMKDRIEAQALRGRRDDVKLSPGGIRDIEFLVQALQIENGASHPKVIGGHTGRALDALQAAACLTDEDARVLREAYEFLRTVEHRLQLSDNLQVHRLPPKERGRTLLTRSLGLDRPVHAVVAGAMAGVRALWNRHLPPRPLV